MQFLRRWMARVRPVASQTVATPAPPPADLPMQLARLRRVLDRLDFGRVSYDALAASASDVPAAIAAAALSAAARSGNTT